MISKSGIVELADGVVCIGPKLKQYRWMHRTNVETKAVWFQFYTRTNEGWRFLNNATHHKIIAKIKQQAGI